VAEGFATFALVFAGCGAVVTDSERGGTLGQVGISAAFGLVIMAMIYATGHVSGAHINPAVTLSFVATRHFSARDAVGYVPAQLVGAVAGHCCYGSPGRARRRTWVRPTRASASARRSSTSSS
jgi:glycerol uptake facilitator-like aquaporin